MTQEQQKLKKPKAGGCIVLAVLAIAVFFLLKSCFSTTPEEEAAYNESKRESLARNTTREAVTERLLSPGSADFSWDVYVKKMTDSTYFVRGYVDSQNAYGAVLRSNYSSLVLFKNDTTAYCIDLNIQ